MMDAYLSREAYRFFEALALVSTEASPDGLLIGHKRGHRYVVEKIFPALKGFSVFPQIYFELDKIFDGKLIGFYSLKPEEKKIKKILAPFAYGKLFLKVHRQENRVAIESFLIDYREGFFLSPIRWKSSK